MEHDDHDDHEGHDHHLHGFSIPVPAGLGRLLQEAAGSSDRSEMQVRSMQERIYSLLDSLNVEQLMALRVMFGTDGKSPMCNYFEGMIVTVLRLTHGVDPESGLTPQEALEQAEAKK